MLSHESCTRFARYACAFAASTLLLAFGASQGAGAAERIRWKMPIAFSSRLPGLGTPSRYVAEMLNKASGGEVQVRVYEPGKLVPSFDILSAVSEGKVNAGYTWIGYDQGRIPAVSLFAAVPFGLKPWAYTGWYYYGGGEEMLQQVYADKGFNVHAVLCGIIGPETAGWYHHPITSIDDYKGMKIRFAGLGGKVLGKLGASVTMLPASQLPQALKNGTIDAAEFSMPLIDRIVGFQEVVKYNLFPGWHQPFTAQYMLVNGDEWKRLSAAHRALIEVTCTAAALRGLSEGEYKNGAVLAGFQHEGVHADQIPLHTLKQLKQVTDKVLAEEASRDDDFKHVWESQKAFQKTYEVWDQRAYLPPDL